MLTLTEESNSPMTGILLFTRIAPDVVFFPKRVPWGPLRTWTLETSKKSKSAPWGLNIYASSTYIAIFWSHWTELLELPKPLNPTATPFCATLALTINIFGTISFKYSILSIPLSSRTAPEKALIEIGTSVTDSSLLLAVVITSSISLTEAEDESWEYKSKIHILIKVNIEILKFLLKRML